MTKNDINSALVEFFRRCRDRNFILSGPMLQEKALFFADFFGIEGFAASIGWLESWQQRNDTSQHMLSGESASADTVLASWDGLLQDEFPLVDEEDVIANRFAIKNNKEDMLWKPIASTLTLAIFHKCLN